MVLLTGTLFIVSSHKSYNLLGAIGSIAKNFTIKSTLNFFDNNGAHIRTLKSQAFPKLGGSSTQSASKSSVSLCLPFQLRLKYQTFKAIIKP